MLSDEDRRELGRTLAVVLQLGAVAALMIYVIIRFI